MSTTASQGSSRLPNCSNTRVCLISCAVHRYAHAVRNLGARFVALVDQGTPLPSPRSLYDVDPSETTSAFVGWFGTWHGSLPDIEAVDALGQEWLERIPPKPAMPISPSRDRRMSLLLDDWIPDDPITIAAKALLPEWIR